MQRGITLLISVLILSSAMSIALGIAYTVLTQFNINRTARESYSAFYAADFGKECAMFYHSRNGNIKGKSFWDIETPCYGEHGEQCKIICGDSEYSVKHSPSDDNKKRTFKAELQDKNSGLCANLTIVSTDITTLIESHGVNDCEFSSGGVNRSIQVCIAPPNFSC